MQLSSEKVPGRGFGIQGAPRPVRARSQAVSVITALPSLPSIVVGIVGVETIYGRHTGGFRVLDALATLSFDSQASLRDRVYGIKETLFHDPYYQRHVVGAPVLRGVGDDGIRCESNYAVFRTKLNGLSTVFNVGRYIDRVVSTPAGLKFAERLAIYDSEMIPNSIIYPI